MILAQTLHFVEPPPKDPVEVGVIYNPQTPGSEDEAKGIVSAIGSDPEVGEFTLHPVAVPLTKLNIAKFQAVISTVGAGTPVLQQALAGRHVVCVTGHRQQVVDGFCQIFMTTEPSVDLRLNQSAVDSADVHFATAFRIMVHAI